MIKERIFASHPLPPPCFAYSSHQSLHLLNKTTRFLTFISCLPPSPLLRWNLVMGEQERLAKLVAFECSYMAAADVFVHVTLPMAFLDAETIKAYYKTLDVKMDDFWMRVRNEFCTDQEVK